MSAAAPSTSRSSSSKAALRARAAEAAWCSSARSPQNQAPSVTSALAASLSDYALLAQQAKNSGTGSGSSEKVANGNSISNGNGAPLAEAQAAADTSANGSVAHAQAASHGSGSSTAQNGEADADGSGSTLAGDPPADGKGKTAASSAAPVPANGRASPRASPRASASPSSGSGSSSARSTISLSATRASSLLYPLPPGLVRGVLRVRIKHELEEGRGKKWIWHKGAVHPHNARPEDEELKAVCERFGYRWDPDNKDEIEKVKSADTEVDAQKSEPAPSRLYLMMLADALLPLPRNQMSGVVSPPLLATTGIVPLSIFSTGPDIIGHYYDCIAAARREVIIMTNYWQGGRNVQTIADALRELNRREKLRQVRGTSAASGAHGKRIVVKVMWDRGPQTLADLFRLRKPVPARLWHVNGLPTPDEIPLLDMEILNYHRPLMGTFHAKLLLVDRRVALVNSNNIQDRPNLEACVRLEGDIVNSVYDHALLSWGNTMRPPLPCLTQPAPARPGHLAFAVTDASAFASAAAHASKHAQGDVGLTTRKLAAATAGGQPTATADGNVGASLAGGAASAAGGASSVGSGKAERGSGSGRGGADDHDEGIEHVLAHLSAGKEALRARARDARQRLRRDDEEAEEEKERLDGRRGHTLADVVDTVMMRRGSNAGTSSTSAAASPVVPKDGAADAKAADASDAATGTDASAAAPGSATAGTAAADSPTTAEDEEHQRQSARKAGALWAHKVLGERFKGFEGLNRGGAGGAGAGASGTPRSPFPSFSFSGNGSAPQSPSTGAGPGPLGSDSLSSNPASRRHFADVVEALMSKEGMRPPGWAEGALEVFGLGESSSRNVAFEARKARREAAQAKLKALNIPTSVVEEDGTTPATATQQQHPASFANTDVPTLATPVPPAQKEQAQEAAIANEDEADSSSRTLPPAGANASQASLRPFPQRSNSVASSTRRADSLRPGVYRNETSASRGDSSSVLHRDGDDGSDSSGSDKEGREHAPGASSYRRRHRRTVSTASKQSAAERLGKITASLDFANNSKVQGEITAAALEALQQAAKEKGIKPPSIMSALINGEDGEDVLDFAPYIFHKPHDPVPIAMVNRRPHGTPGHSDIRNPQDAAWLAGFRYAQKHVFIQSPTLNAAPIKAAVLACVKRHVRVELWLDLGFNDKSESMPFQGGTNEQVVTGLYRHLRKEGKGNEKYLEVYWYTGKDMTRPLNAVRKQRNCHVKFAAYDGQVGIIGSGNQDTQSWFHSQECNVMVDSAQVVGEWMDALRKNQSTHLYGKVDQRDGIWRGATGSEVADTGKA